MNIAVVGIGYVGLAMAVLLSQRHHVTAVDIDAARVDKLGRRQAPIQDADIEAYLSGHELDLTATLDAADAPPAPPPTITTFILINPPFCERDQWGYETRGALSLITID